MTDPILLRSDHGPVARLVLNRPAALNALSDALMAALIAELAELAGDRGIRAVILSGAGRSFCAGHDLREMQAARAAPDQGRAAFADLFRRCTDLMLAIRDLPQPVIAEVQGIAAAAGCQLVATCDLAVAASDSRFGVNGVNIGLFCSTPMVALTRNIGRKQAFEMLVTGGLIDAGQAQAQGLINRVAAPGALQDETMALASRIAAKLPAAVRIGKRTFYDQIDLPLAEAYAHTGAVMVENMLWRDTAEGIGAFLDKRKPDWPA